MGYKYVSVSGVIFGVVAMAHVYRAITGAPILLGSTEVPVWASWPAAIVAGALCVWAFRSR
jgi:hypothetical protein